MAALRKVFADLVPQRRTQRSVQSPPPLPNIALPSSHKVSVINGIRGVLVPGGDEGQPYEVVRKINSKLQHIQDHDCGSGSENDGDVASAKFEARSLGNHLSQYVISNKGF